MAEIKIEKKRASWPWIIAILVIIAAAVYFIFFSNADKKALFVSDVTHLTTSKPAINAFTSYVDRDTTAMGLDHEFTHTALVKLADATQALAEETGYETTAAITEARKCANQITIDPMVSTHADNIKKAANLLSTVLQNIQKANFPELNVEAEQVLTASQAINTDELTLDQKKTVKSFFYYTSVLLKRMN